jgi:hypothetical protein
MSLFSSAFTLVQLRTFLPFSYLQMCFSSCSRETFPGQCNTFQGSTQSRLGSAFAVFSSQDLKLNETASPICNSDSSLLFLLIILLRPDPSKNAFNEPAISVSAHSAGAYTATLLVMKGGGRAPPTLISLG